MGKHIAKSSSLTDQLKILIEEFSSGMEDDASLLDMHETAQQKLVFITNLERTHESMV